MSGECTTDNIDFQSGEFQFESVLCIKYVLIIHMNLCASFRTLIVIEGDNKDDFI